MNVTARFIEGIKSKRWWDAEKVEVKEDKTGKKFVHFYLTPNSADGTQRKIKFIHILKDGKPILEKRIGLTRVYTHDSFMIVMPVKV